ncbi:hypothetical protein [Frankia sp. AgW1.1]|uniref:hypothetical protein n=1 Tax=Frankia sp. AgW1.1 TaxID=1836971 RepID=UPI00193481FA|nr:hypothetical protein [Frankia sp. AgW1.1]MBL7487166.1 hypothetical protein [Frankia sp. AgW1.1]
MDDIGLIGVHLWPLSKQTFANWEGGKVRANVGQLGTVATVMWWEATSTVSYAREAGPLQPLPRPNPLQWLIFDRRARLRLSFSATADKAGVDEAGKPYLSASNLQRLERTHVERAPSERTIVGLARALDVTEATVRDAVARSIGVLDDDAAIEKDIQALVHEIQALSDETRAEAVEYARGAIRVWSRVPPTPQIIDMGQENAEIFDLVREAQDRDRPTADLKDPDTADDVDDGDRVVE